MNRLLRFCSILLVALIGHAAFAQTTGIYPTKVVKFIVPYPAGGGYDTIGRVLAAKLQEKWGPPVVVENRAGANGVIGTAFVAKSAPDGYTIMLGGIGPHAIGPALSNSLPYDPLRDFAPVILVASQQMMLVVEPSVEARSLKEFIALLKANPGRFYYGSNGTGSASHLGAEMFKSIARVNMVHVPYKGSAPTIVGVLGGQVSAVFISVQDVMPHVLSGRLRAIATGGRRRTPALLDVPTLSEAGLPGFELSAWFGVMAPAGTPREIITKINLDIGQILRLPETQKRLSPGGETDIFGGTPEEFRAYVESEISKWTRVVREGNIRAE